MSQEYFPTASIIKKLAHSQFVYEIYKFYCTILSLMVSNCEQKFTYVLPAINSSIILFQITLLEAIDTK